VRGAHVGVRGSHLAYVRAHCLCDVHVLGRTVCAMSARWSAKVALGPGVNTVCDEHTTGCESELGLMVVTVSGARARATSMRYDAMAAPGSGGEHCVYAMSARKVRSTGCTWLLYEHTVSAMCSC